MMDGVVLKIATPEGECYAVFPDDDTSCVLQGNNLKAIAYFEDNLHRMSKDHGHPIELSNIEPFELDLYCNRTDLGISITDAEEINPNLI